MTKHLRSTCLTRPNLGNLTAVQIAFVFVVREGYRVLMAFSGLLALGCGRGRSFDRPIVTYGARV